MYSLHYPFNADWFLSFIEENSPRVYNLAKDECDFINRGVIFKMTDIGDYLNSFGDARRNTKDSYTETLDVERYKKWKSKLMSQHRRCEVSNFTIYDIKDILYRAYGEDLAAFYGDSYIQLHHIDGKPDIETYDDFSVQVVAVGPHLFLHRQHLLNKCSRLAEDYELQVELGALIPRRGTYFWIKDGSKDKLLRIKQNKQNFLKNNKKETQMEILFKIISKKSFEKSGAEAPALYYSCKPTGEYNGKPKWNSFNTEDSIPFTVDTPKQIEYMVNKFKMYRDSGFNHSIEIVVLKEDKSIERIMPIAEFEEKFLNIAENPTTDEDDYWGDIKPTTKAAVAPTTTFDDDDIPF